MRLIFVSFLLFFCACERHVAPKDSQVLKEIEAVLSDDIMQRMGKRSAKDTSKVTIVYFNKEGIEYAGKHSTKDTSEVTHLILNIRGNKEYQKVLPLLEKLDNLAFLKLNGEFYGGKIPSSIRELSVEGHSYNGHLALTSFHKNLLSFELSAPYDSVFSCRDITNMRKISLQCPSISYIDLTRSKAFYLETLYINGKGSLGQKLSVKDNFVPRSLKRIKIVDLKIDDKLRDAIKERNIKLEYTYNVRKKK